jgi:hypothetical protein
MAEPGKHFRRRLSILHGVQEQGFEYRWSCAARAVSRDREGVVTVIMDDSIDSNYRSINDSDLLQRNIFRLAAVLYSETTNTFSNIDVQLHIVKCIFAKYKNEPMPIDLIISNIISTYKFDLSEEELCKILSKPQIFETISINHDKAYRLSQQEYEKTIGDLSKNIDYYIANFISINLFKENEATVCRDAIYQYIYELTTTNINSYKILFSAPGKSNFSDSDLSVNLYNLTDIGREYVHSFIEWGNSEKNIVLSNIVFCCLEYCLMVSGDKPSSLITEIIRNREIYLDTNIIFRVLGINGLSRQNVIDAFLRKCNQANIKIVISKATRVEFFSTIDYYVSQINEFPRGKVFMGAYESLSDYNFYSFYDEWCNRHENLSLKYFRVYIDSLYDEFIKKYKVHDNTFISDAIFNSLEYKNIGNLYAQNISDTKKELKSRYISDDSWISNSDKHDAFMVRYIELYRDQGSKDTDIFFVSSDKALRYWDMTRSRNGYPIVIYPSQLFLILVKLCGRSENDLESFVNFINIRPRSEQLTAEKANVIISGISSITEDINVQRNIISVVFDEEFQNIIKRSNTDHELYQNTQLYSQNYLERELKLKNEALQASDNQHNMETAQIKELSDIIQQKDLEIKELVPFQEGVYKMAEQKVIPAFWFRWYVTPVLLVILSIFATLFIALQFIFCDTSWNLVSCFFDFIKKTTFGKGVGNFVYIIDVALIALIKRFFKSFWKNPFNTEDRNKDKALMIDKYIKKKFRKNI